MTDVDALVIGGGLGGCLAALAAARRDPSAAVHLVAGTGSPFERATGLCGVLGFLPDGDGPVPDPFGAIPDLPADHPYHVLGVDALREGLALFDDATAGDYCGEHTDANALPVTTLGRPTPTARYPAAVEPGLASREAETLLVGFEDLPDFHAPLAAERLRAADVPFDVSGVTTHAPVVVREESAPLTIAAALDADEQVGTRDVTARESLASAVRSVADGEDRVGFPAVLGFDEAAAVHADLAAALDADVFEVPLGSPSVLGARLEATLHDALRAASITIHEGCDVVGHETTAGGPTSEPGEGQAITRVRVDTTPGLDGGETLTLEPDSVILATGGPADGGIVADRETVREPLFDCPVTGPVKEEPRASEHPMGDHAFARFGLQIDGAARPLAADGSPAYVNLHAAGTIVGSADLVAEGSREGVAMASAAVAGARAVE